MPFVYFGYPSRASGVGKLTYRTDDGELVPMEPSKVKVFVQTLGSTAYSLMISVLGLIVGTLSHLPFSYSPLIAQGVMTVPDDTEDLPFGNPGLAVVLRKGGKLADTKQQLLESRGFTMTSFQGRTVYLLEDASLNDYIITEDLAGTDTKGPCPNRFLNQSAFESWLIFRNVLKKICQLFHFLAQSNSVTFPSPSDPRFDAKSDVFRRTTDNFQNDIGMAQGPFEFKTSGTFKPEGMDAQVSTLIKASVSASGIQSTNSRVCVNPISGPLARGFINSGDIGDLSQHGLIFKYIPKLAIPDANLITDVLGSLFLAAFGSSWSEQIENLALMKKGLGNLRLTSVGDEITHLMKCLEIATRAHCGVIPIFTRTVYEGCVLSGGPGARIIIQDKVFPFLDLPSLKNEFLTVSTHAHYLSLIANEFTDNLKPLVLKCDSMRKLWAYCQMLVCTADTKTAIERYASHLDFGTPPLTMNPHTLAQVFGYIVDTNRIPLKAPICRLALFSRDPVLLALGCFGEETAPCWNAPGGIACSISKRNPPAPLIPDTKKRNSTGVISDAAWVMTVLKTDVVTAVEEFKKMAVTMKYRSVSSSLAKKVGHTVYRRERMAEFWIPMQDALRAVNPKAIVDQEETSISGTSEETVGRVPKRKGMDFASPVARKLFKSAPPATTKGKEVERTAEETEQWLQRPENVADTARQMKEMLAEIQSTDGDALSEGEIEM